MSELDEVIARAERAMRKHGNVSEESDVATLLAAARRVQAMEDTVGFAKEVREHVAENGMLNARFVEQQYPLLLDLASDQSAARARVAELEAELSRAIRSLHERGHKQEASTFYRFLPEVAL